MSRVIAGVAGGRRLVMPAGEATRPTADRAREGLFSSLTSMVGSLEGLRFLDLYAGSGAVGFEASSRGAAHVLLVERDLAALRAIRTNLGTLALRGVELRADAVARVIAARPESAFDVVFLDPPYSDPVDEVLAELLANDWLAEDAVVCVERASRRGEFAWPSGLAPIRSRRYGEATLCYGRRS